MFSLVAQGTEVQKHQIYWIRKGIPGLSFSIMCVLQVLASCGLKYPIRAFAPEEIEFQLFDSGLSENHANEMVGSGQRENVCPYDTDKYIKQQGLNKGPQR